MKCGVHVFSHSGHCIGPHSTASPSTTWTQHYHSHRARGEKAISRRLDDEWVDVEFRVSPKPRPLATGAHQTFPDRMLYLSVMNEVNEHGAAACTGDAANVAKYASEFKLAFWAFWGPGDEEALAVDRGNDP